MDGIAPIYRFIVAHLVPGALAIIPLSWLSDDAHHLLSDAVASGSTVNQGFILMMVALVLGLLIDGVCFVSVEPLVAAIRKHVRHQPSANQAPTTTDDFDFIDRVNSMHYTWMQLYASSGAVMFFAAVVVALGGSPLSRLHFAWLMVAAVLLVLASARASANGERLLAARFGEDTA